MSPNFLSQVGNLLRSIKDVLKLFSSMKLSITRSILLALIHIKSYWNDGRQLASLCGENHVQSIDTIRKVRAYSTYSIYVQRKVYRMVDKTHWTISTKILFGIQYSHFTLCTVIYRTLIAVIGHQRVETTSGARSGSPRRLGVENKAEFIDHMIVGTRRSRYLTK